MEKRKQVIASLARAMDIRKMHRRCHIEDLEIICICIRTYYKRKAIWAEYLPACTTLFDSEVRVRIAAKNISIAAGCIYLFKERNFQYSHILRGLQTEINAANIAIDPMFISISSEEEFIQSLSPLETMIDKVREVDAMSDQ